MSQARSIADQFFFARAGMDPDRITKITTSALRRADAGELYLQRDAGRSFSFSDGKLESSSETLDQGFGFRFVTGDSYAYAYSSDLSERTIKSLAASTGAIRNYAAGTAEVIALPAPLVLAPLYVQQDLLAGFDDALAIKILGDIDARARAADPRVTQVSASIGISHEIVTIIRRDGQRLDDVRPMTVLSVSVTAQQAGQKKKGSSAASGRVSLTELFARNSWQDAADQAVRQALLNLDAVPAPVGEMPVVLGNGWAAVMLHESVGHGLEGDHARKDMSVYAGKVGQRVAAKGVTIIDQGDIPEIRGALHFDDEGTPTQKNVLIEDGILKGYMQDIINARMMNVAPTGNGRRQDYRHAPIPRMTTTYMAAGHYDPAEIIASVDRGVYAVDFSGGQVDTVSGSFVFSPTEAYLIEKGKIVGPVENAILSGNGPESMKMVDMVGNDLGFGKTGSCGKDRQSVPVGIGQPTVKMRGIKVGGKEPS